MTMDHIYVRLFAIEDRNPKETKLKANSKKMFFINKRRGRELTDRHQEKNLSRLLGQFFSIAEPYHNQNYLLPFHSAQAGAAQSQRIISTKVDLA
mmetsp:Transcript_7999/g.11347  ORF Transcript_7999/g.11347 Transcript_7999/m.11347 type:complete len:95 (-) Transcript_7999:3520-3804(-)